MCPYVSGLNDFKTIFSGKITGRNKYFNTWNEARPWVAEVNRSLFFKLFLKLFLRHHNFFCHLFPIQFTKIIIRITKQQKNPSWLLSDKVSFLLPSPFSPWMEITACQCLQQLAHRQIFQQEHLAGWQAPEAVVLAASTEPGQCWGWGHTAGTVPLTGLGLWHSTGCTSVHPEPAPAAPRAANPSKPQLTAPGIWVGLRGSLAMALCVLFWRPRVVWNFTCTSVRWPSRLLMQL